MPKNSHDSVQIWVSNRRGQNQMSQMFQYEGWRADTLYNVDNLIDGDGDTKNGYMLRILLYAFFVG